MSKNSRRPQGLPPVKPLESVPSSIIDMPVEVNPLSAELDQPLARVNPSEFDPDVDPDIYDGQNIPVQAAIPLTEEEIEARDAILAEVPSTGVDHLGRPAQSGFDPRDPNMPFYQGICPHTGERVYSRP